MLGCFCSIGICFIILLLLYWYGCVHLAQLNNMLGLVALKPWSLEISDDVWHHHRRLLHSKYMKMYWLYRPFFLFLDRPSRSCDEYPCSEYLYRAGYTSCGYPGIWYLDTQVLGSLLEIRHVETKLYGYSFIHVFRIVFLPRATRYTYMVTHFLTASVK
jgi:hypothetical protein